jgi:predicted permease
MIALPHDLRYAARQLLRTPGFTAAAVVTLALGIAVNTAFFAIVNAVVFRPMRSVELEHVYQPTFRSSTSSWWGSLPLRHFRLLEANLPESMEAVDAQITAPRDAIVHVPGRAERVEMLAVSGGHAAVFRLRTQAGRFITADDDRERLRAVVISDRLWREWFAGDRDVVERANIRIDNDVFQIVGVGPPGYRGALGFGLSNIDVWVPLWYLEQRREGFGAAMAFVRLKPGVAPTSAAPQVLAAIAEADRDVRPFMRLATSTAALRPATDGNPFRSVGVALLWLSSLVLLAACANLANMLYVRGVHRRAELAVRQALGASSRRIFQLLLAEALIIGTAGTALGLALAIGATRQFAAAFPTFHDRAARVTVDLTPDYFVFGYAFAAGVTAALLVGLTSAWRASRVPPMRGMAAGDAATSVTRTSRRMRLGLVVVQVAAAVILLLSAGLFFQQSRGQFQSRPRFATAVLATARIDLARHGYTRPDAEAFFRRLLAGTRALPGMEEAAIGDGMPGGLYMGGSELTFVAERPDRPFTRQITPSHPRADGTLISAAPGFLRTLGLAVVQGRDLNDGDRDGAELVVVMSDGLAARLWPHKDPVGRRVMFGGEGHWRTVVGIFRDPVTPGAAAGGSRFVISPLDQRQLERVEPAARAQRDAADPSARAPQPPREMLVLLRASNARGQLDALRTEVAAIDPHVAVFDAATVDESILAATAPRRAGRLLLGSLGLVALAIATLGVYSVMSFLVARRTREFGIRLALGAERRQILKAVMDEAVHLLLVGLLAGVFIAAVGERLIQARTTGFMPNDESTWAVVLVLMLAVGLLAAFLPARRAAAIDPNLALRDL